jgi:hypothetical protein
MEVSSTWIQREEKIAASLIQFDSCPWTPGAGESNNIDNRCVCSPQSGLVDEPSHTELKKSYLSHLDGTCLMALEKIIREAQIGEVDSAAAVPQSPALESLEQPATQTSSFVERGCGSYLIDKLTRFYV